MNSSNNTTSNDQTGIEVVSTRYTLSIILFSLAPLHIWVNLLTLIIICIFRQLQTTQEMLVANIAINGLFAGLVSNPVYGTYLYLHSTQNDILADQFTCISFFVPVIFLRVTSSVNLAMISADRFFAIKYPFKYVETVSVEKLRRVIVFEWVSCAFLALLPYAWNNYKDGECHIFLTLSKTYTRLFVFPIFTTSFIAASVFNIIVFRIAFNTHQKLRSSKRQSRSAKLSCLLYISYIVTVTPFLISTTLILMYGYPAPYLIRVFNTVASVVLNLQFTCNTLVYVLVKKQTRKAFKLVLTTAPCNWSKLQYAFYDEGTTVAPANSQCTNPGTGGIWAASRITEISSRIVSSNLSNIVSTFLGTTMTAEEENEKRRKGSCVSFSTVTSSNSSGSVRIENISQDASPPQSTKSKVHPTPPASKKKAHVTPPASTKKAHETPPSSKIRFHITPPAFRSRSKSNVDLSPPASKTKVPVKDKRRGSAKVKDHISPESKETHRRSTWDYLTDALTGQWLPDVTTEEKKTSGEKTPSESGSEKSGRK